MTMGDARDTAKKKKATEKKGAKGAKARRCRQACRGRQARREGCRQVVQEVRLIPRVCPKDRAGRRLSLATAFDPGPFCR